MTNHGAAGLRHRPVRYALGPEGTLVATGPPDRELVARDEATLYRRLTALRDASDDVIVAAASRYGALGPVSRLRPPDPELYLWLLAQGMRSQSDWLTELRRWVATGGTVRIPARLAPTARMVVAFADLDPEVTAAIHQLLTGARDPVDLPDRFTERAGEALLAYEGAVDATTETFRTWISDPEALVLVKVHPGARSRLANSAALVRAIFEVAMASGGYPALDSHSFHSLAVEVSPYGVAPIFGLGGADTIESWRTASAELQLWADALRDLRALRRGGSAARTPALAPIQLAAGLPAALVSVDRSFTDPADLSAALATLLTFRLRRIGAWPYPADQLAGTFARALWGLWGPITDQRPPRGLAPGLTVAPSSFRRAPTAIAGSAGPIRKRRIVSGQPGDGARTFLVRGCRSAARLPSLVASSVKGPRAAPALAALDGPLGPPQSSIAGRVSSYRRVKDGGSPVALGASAARVDVDVDGRPARGNDANNAGVRGRHRLASNHGTGAIKRGRSHGQPTDADLTCVHHDEGGLIGLKFRRPEHLREVGVIVHGSIKGELRLDLALHRIAAFRSARVQREQGGWLATQKHGDRKNSSECRQRDNETKSAPTDHGCNVQRSIEVPLGALHL